MLFRVYVVCILLLSSATTISDALAHIGIKYIQDKFLATEFGIMVDAIIYFESIHASNLLRKVAGYLGVVTHRLFVNRHIFLLAACAAVQVPTATAVPLTTTNTNAHDTEDSAPHLSQWLTGRADITCLCALYLCFTALFLLHTCYFLRTQINAFITKARFVIYGTEIPNHGTIVSAACIFASKLRWVPLHYCTILRTILALLLQNRFGWPLWLSGVSAALSLLSLSLLKDR